MISREWWLKDWQRKYCSERDLSKRTKGFYADGVSKFERWNGGPLTVQDAAEKWNSYLDCLSDGNRYTAASNRNAIRALLRAAADEGICLLPGKIKPIRTPRHRPRAIHPSEIISLLKHADPIQAAAIRLVYDTGYRKDDTFSAKRGEFFNGKIIRTISKTGRLGSRRIRPKTIAAIEAVKNDQDDRLLPMEVGYTGWRKRWHALGRRAGVDTFRRGLQAIRRTGATMAKKSGQSAADYLGHSPGSGDLADRYYIDPGLLDDEPPLPPEID